MEKNSENVILFPTWQKKLEIESLQALKEKKYTEALPKLNQLLSYNMNNHEIIVGKLICLMELGHGDEAQSLCEELLTYKNEHYYHYVHIYLTILFQTNQYQLLMDHVEYELEDHTIPDIMADQFQQLFDMAKQMENDVIQKKTTEYMIELTEAVTERNHMRQWQLIENLRRMKIEPTAAMISYLVNDQIHPVIKTVIFKWLRDQEISEDVEVHKLDAQLTIKPNTISAIRKHPMIKQILLLISELEQENPSLFILLEQILYRYIYVRYPIMPSNDKILLIAEALRSIGGEYLHMNTERTISADVEKYIKEIKMCETLYLSIIEE